jgi:hypothetical protein
MEKGGDRRETRNTGSNEGADRVPRRLFPIVLAERAKTISNQQVEGGSEQ